MRIAIVTDQPISWADAPMSGFASRWASIVRILAADHDVVLFFADCGNVEFESSAAEASRRVDLRRVKISRRPNSRFNRLIRVIELLSGPLGMQGWERELSAAVGSVDPEVVVAISVDKREKFRSLAYRFPVLLIAEEDDSTVIRVNEWNPPKSRLGELFEHVEERAESRSLSKVPVVGVISPGEVSWARHRFRRASVRVLPHVIHEDYWAAPVPRQESLIAGDVFVIGRFEDARNANGLRAIVDALRDAPGKVHPRLLIASPGLHPRLRDLPADLLCWLGAVADPRPYYRAAACSLVPSFVVAGAKTTILQSWAAECPVVTTIPAAESVGAVDGIDLLAGATPPAVVRRLCTLISSDELRNRLVVAGRRSLSQRNSAAALRLSLNQALSLVHATS